MKYDPNKHHRRSIRLQGYDYASVGIYFVTICTQGLACLFGQIKAGTMELNEAGVMVQAAWLALPERFPNIELDEFVVMPNHFHGIIVLQNSTPNQPTLGEMMGAFKSMTTYEYIQGVRQSGWLPFDRRVWQRNYWEHIIRDETAWRKIREYIRNNPATWVDDRLHPNAPVYPIQ